MWNRSTLVIYRNNSFHFSFGKRTKQTLCFQNILLQKQILTNHDHNNILSHWKETSITWIIKHPWLMQEQLPTVHLDRSCCNILCTFPGWFSFSGWCSFILQKGVCIISTWIPYTTQNTVSIAQCPLHIRSICRMSSICLKLNKSVAIPSLVTKD